MSVTDFKTGTKVMSATGKVTVLKTGTKQKFPLKKFSKLRTKINGNRTHFLERNFSSRERWFFSRNESTYYV